jgi:uncharacterized protein (TIGR00369 family)
MQDGAPPPETTSTDDSGWHWRSYPWAPADTSNPPLAERSGLEYFTALKDGTLPPQPITQTIGWQIETVAYGLLRLTLTPGDYLFHGGGLLHGGVVATLLDSAMSGAVMSTLQIGQACTTLQLNVNNVRGVRPGSGVLTAEGRVKHGGRTSATAEGSLFDSAGRLHAHATTTCLIFPLGAGA